MHTRGNIGGKGTEGPVTVFETRGGLGRFRLNKRFLASGRPLGASLRASLARVSPGANQQTGSLAEAGWAGPSRATAPACFPKQSYACKSSLSWMSFLTRRDRTASVAGSSVQGPISTDLRIGR